MKREAEWKYVETINDWDLYESTRYYDLFMVEHRDGYYQTYHSLQECIDCANTFTRPPLELTNEEEN